MARRTTSSPAQVTKTSPKLNAPNNTVVELLGTPEGMWMAARQLAASRFWPTAPAIKALILRMMPDGTPGLPTMAVDEYYRCYTTPAFMAKLVQMAREVSADKPCPNCGATYHHPLTYISGTIVHESQHPIRKHANRARAVGADSRPKTWNVAADLEINDDIQEGFNVEKNVVTSSGNPNGAYPCLPPFVVFPKLYNEKFAEFGIEFKDDYPAEYYWYSLLDLADKIQEELDKVNKELKEKYPGSGEKSEQDSGGDDQGEGEDDSEDEDENDSGDGEQDQNDEGDSEEDQLRKRKKYLEDLLGPPEQNCGSGAHGSSSDYEDGPPSGDNPGISDAENNAIQREIAKEIRQRHAVRGDVPAGFVRWAEEILTPAKVDWRQVLQHLVQLATQRIHGYDRRSWHRLGRSSASTGYRFLYPSTYTPIPKIGIVLDTSGSMGGGPGSPLYEATVEVEGICQQLNAIVTIVSVDAAAGEIQEVTSIKDLKMQGGGGTDMRVGVTALEEYPGKPNVCIIVTDGYTPWPQHPSKDMEIIAAIVGDGINDKSMLAQIPSHIEVVLVDD